MNDKAELLTELVKQLHNAEFVIYNAQKEPISIEAKGFLHDAGACLRAGVETLKEELEKVKKDC